MKETDTVYIEDEKTIEAIDLDKDKIAKVIEAKRNNVELILTFTFGGQDFRISSKDINIKQ